MYIIAEIGIKPIGQNKSKWKGGLMHCNGYAYVYSPDHPNKNGIGSGYVKRARLVMEKHIGRYLDRSEFVHHMNGKRDDDRIENLQLTNLSKHQKYHQPMTARLMERDSNGRFLRKKGNQLCT